MNTIKTASLHKLLGKPDISTYVYFHGAVVNFMLPEEGCYSGGIK